MILLFIILMGIVAPFISAAISILILYPFRRIWK